MDLRQYIKHFTFTEKDRGDVTLGTDTRLNPVTHRAQLGTYGVATYPTIADLYVKTRLTNPEAVRQWLGFEVEVIHKSILGVQKTSVGFRLSDGTNQYWWTGSAWQINTSNWNTEAEVATNISTFPATSRKLQVVANLKTVDSSVTPELVEIRVLYGAQLDSELEDMILRTIVRGMKSIRAITRFPIKMATTGITIDLDNFPLDSDYNVVDVDAAFNHTDDPDHNADLLDSYDSGTKVITLVSQVTAGKTVWLRLEYKPRVAVHTSRDYIEVEHIPSLIIEDVALVDAVQRFGEDYVGKRSDYSATILPAPTQGNLDFTLSAIADKVVDGLRLSAAVKRWFGDNPLIRSTGLDEAYSLRLVDEYEHRGTPSEEDLFTWRATFRVRNFCIWTRSPESGYLVKKFSTTGDLDMTVE